MKRDIERLILFLLIFSASTAVFAGPAGGPPNYSAAWVKQELTTHQWTLVEIVQTKNDTATNLTLFMLPCEKDNYLAYETNGTYQIMEGQSKCANSDGNVKGKGTWEYEETDRTLYDSYAGGRRIEKKVLEISPGMLKVQYESEGRKITTLTYFSETGAKDEGLKDLVVDNSDNTKSIIQAPREVLQETRRYIVVGRRDFDKGVPITIDDKGGVLKKVAVYPFLNSTDANLTTDESARNKTLLAQGTKVGLDYIVTGNILKAASDVTPDGKYQGNVKYSVTILDVKSGQEKITKTFTYSEKEQEAKKKQDAIVLGALLGAAGHGYYGYYGWRRGYWDYYYGYYFYSSSASYLVADGLSCAFNNGYNDERKRYYQSSLAVVDAISHTTDDLSKFIIENIPLTFKILRVDDDKKGKVTIEAGTNANVQEGETLKMVRIRETVLSDGSKEIETQDVGKFVVESVNSMRLSSCKPSWGDASKIAKALKDKPEELFVQTTEVYRSKK